MAGVIIPSTTYPVHHFKKYRTIALCLATVSSPLIFVCAPPLITSLLDSYGWRDTNLVLSAICLQVMISVYTSRSPAV